MKLYKSVRIDLYNTLPLPVLEAQQNNMGRGVEITLTAGAEIVDPSDEEVNMYCKKPDGTLSYISCSVVNGNIRAVFTNQMLAVPGTIQVELQIISGTDEITTPIFLLKVNPSNIDSEAIESQNEFTALQQALSELAYLKANGLKGDPGEAATLQIGTVTASEPGSNPVVTNSGTEQNAILNFVIPRGKEGPTGPPISTVNPAEATEADSGKAADAYYTRQIVGDLSDLPTSDKSSLVAAISEQNVNKENKLTFDVSKVINFMSGIKVYHTKCRRYGKLCVGYFNCRITKEFTANSVIATVPFTAESWTFIPLRNNSNFNSRGSISSGSNEIKIEFAIPANTDFIGEFIWFTND